MYSDPAHPPALKPRILIADDSRIVRATLIKHIEGMFDFREALDGEQAWEALLLDPGIRVVISDLTMPKLDGYGLLQRIRSSKISRIRTIPVVVVSGNDDQAERERAKAAGATDLITKGIGTAQLLSRLDILAKLTSTQNEFERGLQFLMRQPDSPEDVALPTLSVWEEQAGAMHASATRQRRNFVVLHICLGLKHAGLEGYPMGPPRSLVQAVGQLLYRTVRQSDCVTQIDEAEFVIATGSIHFDSARNFAERVCRAIVHAHPNGDGEMFLVASCGVVSVSESSLGLSPSLLQLREAAVRRARLGLQHGVTGVIAAQETQLLESGLQLPMVTASLAPATPAEPSVDLPTLLRWIAEGKEGQVTAHLDHLSHLAVDWQPLMELMLKHKGKR
ncbi:response regulator [uncultured Oxalicibacterium sp.]|uniref:response regulator n=1 Tax=uncultured Oxalicibacterium sp. TaxID=1168540 RepID=UPI0025EF932F|nr:response regulator [uncultured Oxalicibacterium sp.]